MIPDEEVVVFYTKYDERLQEEIKKAQHELETLLKTQHNVRRILNLYQTQQKEP
jgi:prefoldin subunit 5